MGAVVDAAREHAMKILVGAAGSLGVWLVTMTWTWLQANIVLAGDLNMLRDQIGAEIQKQLAPIIAQQSLMSRQQALNALAICTGRKAQLKSASRNVKVQIDDMEKERTAKPTAWTARDQLLLEELQNDLDQVTDEYNNLACKDVAPPQ